MLLSLLFSCFALALTGGMYTLYALGFVWTACLPGLAAMVFGYLGYSTWPAKSTPSTTPSKDENSPR